MQQKLLQSAKILERMLNLNTFDDIAQVLTKYIISSSLQCFWPSFWPSLCLPIRTFVTGTTLETNFVFQLVFSSLCGSVFSFEIVKSKDKRQLSKIRKLGVFRILTSKLKASLRSQQLVGTRNTGGEKTPKMMFAILPQKFHWLSVQWNAVCICLLNQSCCSDLFAASYGSFDFYSQPNLGNHYTIDYWTIVRVYFAQPWWSLNVIDYWTILIAKIHKCAGYVCLFSLKNPSYPEYICKTNSGVSEKQLVKLISVWNNKGFV